jgi:hypothetical protein
MSRMCNETIVNVRITTYEREIFWFPPPCIVLLDKLGVSYRVEDSFTNSLVGSHYASSSRISDFI